MSSDEYKIECRRPDAFRHSVLKETVCVLRLEVPELASRIEQVLTQPSIERPFHYSGDATDNFIRVSISSDDAEIIRDAFVIKEAEAVSPDGSTTALASHYADMADTWTNYLIWLENGLI